MNTAMTLRVDAKVKEDAAFYLSQVGLTTSEAVRLFLHSVVLHKGIPFELKVPTAQTAQAMHEVMAGDHLETVTMAQMLEDLQRARD